MTDDQGRDPTDPEDAQGLPPDEEPLETDEEPVEDEATAAEDRPYDEIADLIGSVTGLPPDLSDSSGERFAEIVRQKARTR